MRASLLDHLSCALLGGGLGTLVALQKEIRHGMLGDLFWIGVVAAIAGLCLIPKRRSGEAPRGD